ncbi:uncharacterized protein [Nicotiana sylvestris]|uniref:uncharacterized protein n=1 Tax=Nicotiana sylvestris TaxID=4096 RepID=UPI00388C8B16
MKAQALADHLAENPVDDEYQPLSTYFLNNEVNLVENELADALATLASMLPYPGNLHIDPLEIQIRERHGYCNRVEMTPNVQPWYHDINRFLKMKEYFEQANGDQKRTIRRLAGGFFLSGEVHGDLIHAPPIELHPMSAPWPFVAWGMDVIGLIEPKTSNGHRFILVAIDYFTKWVEAITLKSVTKKAVVDFAHSNLISRFGIPATIITDNAANLNSHLIREICEQFKITYRNSTPYRPKANGAVEAANKNIKKILRKMIQSSRQWHEKFPFALLGYRTIVGTSVRATPYFLVYGTEAVIPAEVEIPSLRIIVEAEIEDNEWVKTCLEQLTLIDEKQMATVCHGQLYQQRMARAYNKKVRSRNFEVGQLVLRRILPHHQEAKGKFAPNWKGPYFIRKLLPKEALYLGDIEGNDPKTAVNGDAVKRYYV